MYFPFYTWYKMGKDAKNFLSFLFWENFPWNHDILVLCKIRQLLCWLWSLYLVITITSTAQVSMYGNSYSGLFIRSFYTFCMDFIWLRKVLCQARSHLISSTSNLSRRLKALAQSPSSLEVTNPGATFPGVGWIVWVPEMKE